jgi:signal transduction histidine kinase
MPDYAVWATILLSFLPAMLHWLGVDFSSSNVLQNQPLLLLQQPNAAEISGVGQAYTLMEWTAFCVAGFTAIIALFQFRVHQDIAMPLVGIAMFCAGTFDFFRTLAILNISGSVSDPAGFLPFTWVIARIFHALILVMGVALVMRTPPKRRDRDIFYSLLVSLAFMVIAYVIIELIANNNALPETYFPGHPASRPYDLIPLALFALAGVVLFPRFHQRRPTIFSHALIIMALPAVVAQLHMAFGSKQLFDTHFNIAHFLKMVTFLVPFAGVCFEQMRLQNQLEHEIQDRKDAEEALAARAEDLTRSNLELERFAYVASHDLKEPLRMVASYVQLLERRYEHRLDDKGKEYISTAVDGANRMQTLIDDLLAYSKAGHGAERFKRHDLEDVVATVKTDLSVAIQSSGAQIRHDPMPSLVVDPSLIGQLFQNLVANALKFRSADSPEVYLSAKEQESTWLFSVKDNGIGIDSEYREKVFQVFERLHTREKYSGTGVGLSICKKIVERHGGSIWIESEPGEGTTFLFTLSKNIEEVSDASSD